MEEKRIWNLTWNTNVYASDDDGMLSFPVTASYLYTDFEAAKRDALKVIEKYVHSDNGLFDGEGGIPEFNRAMERMMSDEEFEEEDGDGYGDGFSHPIKKESINPFLDSLKKTIESLFKEKPMCLHGDISYMIKIDSSPEKVYVKGIDDGPPCRIYINMFDMSDPKKDYMFEVNNAFDYYGMEDVKYIGLYLFSMVTDEEVDMKPFM